MSSSALSPRAFIARWIQVLVLLAVWVGSVGCAGLPVQEDEISVRPLGPGTMFSTVDAAVLDALAWSHLESQREPLAERRTRGGTIIRVGSRFSYAQPAVASPENRQRVVYSLGSDAVAHYRVNVATASSDSQDARVLERVNVHDRTLVDRHDKAHRPFYLLTPRLRVQAYGGERSGPEWIARLDRDQLEAGAAIQLVNADVKANVMARVKTE